MTDTALPQPEPGTPSGPSRAISTSSGYSSFRDLPTLTHVSGAAIIVFGLTNLGLTLFEFERNGLLWLFFYSVPANTAISVFPHEPVIVYYGQYFGATLVALVAVAGNLAAAFVDYHFFTHLLEMKFASGYRKSKTYSRAIGWFSAAPFWSVVLFALTPLPFYIVKFLAFSSRYSMHRYLAAIAVGRLPRFFLLAMLGSAVHVPVWIMIVVFAAIFAVYIILILRGLVRARRTRPRSRNA